MSPVETSVEMSPQRQLAKSSATSCVLEKEEGEFIASDNNVNIEIGL